MNCKEIFRVKRVPNGKTLELYVKICSGRIENIVISGDFFAHPEEVIEEIENNLRGVNIERVNSVLENFRNKLFFTGFNYSVFIDFINEVLSEACRE